MEVFGIPVEKLPGLLTAFGRVEAVGQSFPVYKVVSTDGVSIDVALPRRESKHGRGHKGFEVRGDPVMSFDEAARRRDFTINAISWDPLTDEYVDPVGGRADLERRCFAPSTRGRSATTASAPCVRCSSPRASSSASTKRPRRSAGAFGSTICRPNGSGASWRSCCCGRRRPSIGFRLARDLGIIEQVMPGDGAAHRLRAGTRVAPRR